jgi:hypothetical protein
MSAHRTICHAQGRAGRDTWHFRVPGKANTSFWWNWVDIWVEQSLVLAWLPREDGTFLTANPQSLVQQGKVANVPFVTGEQSVSTRILDSD